MSIQTAIQRRRFSQLRQKLLALTDELRRLVEPFMAQAPVTPGSVYQLKRKCGKPNCRCASGQLHARMVLSTKVGGKTKLRVIPRGGLVEVRQKAARYRELRQARARLNALHRRMVATIDEMETMRRDEMD